MATGGTGDILTGMVAGMVAQNPERAFEAVLCAVHMHGLAGDLAAWSYSETLSGVNFGWHPIVATDLLKVLPLLFPRLRTRAQQPWIRIAGA
jgi:NAD(P)H-hydrate epimerase